MVLVSMMCRGLAVTLCPVRLVWTVLSWVLVSAIGAAAGSGLSGGVARNCLDVAGRGPLAVGREVKGEGEVDGASTGFFAAVYLVNRMVFVTSILIWCTAVLLCLPCGWGVVAYLVHLWVLGGLGVGSAAIDI